MCTWVSTYCCSRSKHICFDCSPDPSISAPTLERPRSRIKSFNSHCVCKELRTIVSMLSPVVMEWVHQDHEEQAL
ncbi:hypothetical protein T08_16795 [Trichinella sp. T8]|nr:hypothetical protein T08_16795 [Trichinella sp. T8]